MILKNRVLYYNGSSLEDLSESMNDITVGTKAFTYLTGHYIYVGSDLPFNHRYFGVSTVNATAANISVQLWDGKAWVAPAEVIDNTKLSGASMGRSGVVSWVPKRNENWKKEQSTADIPALSTVEIYDRYWARISFNVNINFSLDVLTHRFSDDSKLGIIYPDLINTKTLTAFKAGKTSWEEQHLLAAQQIIEELQKIGAATSGDQILVWDKFQMASMHLVASYIFRSFGDDFKDQFEQAVTDYKEAINMTIFDTDKNNNAKLDESESVKFTGVSRA